MSRTPDLKPTGYHLKIVFQNPDHAISISTDKSVVMDEIEGRWHKIVERINEANQPGITRGVGYDILEELERMGQKLCDEFLPADIREKLITTSAEHLILEIDSQLVHIPWELIHLNGEFLCQRFSMGRLPSTYQKVPAFEKRELGSPSEMWVVADPGGNLSDARSEGKEICNQMDQMDGDDPLAYADLDTEIGPDDIRERIKGYDFVHFAGHATYDPDDPAQSGWLLTHGRFTAKDIEEITGGKAMPALVFSNACQSARTEKWVGDETFGLANAFMLAGVRHYLGTSWEIKDKPSSQFALRFYKHLFSGKKTVGDAVRQARLALTDRRDTSWAGYLLYGDPRTAYFGKNAEAENWIKLQVTATKTTVAGPTVEQTEDGGKTDSAVPKTSQLSGTKPKWSQLASQIVAGLAVLILIVWLIHVIPPVTDPPKPPSENSLDVQMRIFHERNLEKKKRIDELWEKLQKITGTSPGNNPVDDSGWTSPPLTMAFVFESQMDFSEQKKEDLLAYAIQIGVSQSSSIQLLHRKSFDAILEELIRASGSSVDPKHRLKPKLKMPTYLLFVERNQSESSPLALMELAETQTALSLAFLHETIDEGKSVLAQRERLSQKLLVALKKLEERPIRGRISKVAGEEIILNVGEDEGVRIGQRFKVVDQSLILEVESIKWNGTSMATVEEGDITPEKGSRVEAIKPMLFHRRGKEHAKILIVRSREHQAALSCAPKGGD